MKTYYLVAQKTSSSPEHFDVFVTDNPKGFSILQSFYAQSYNDALKRFSFKCFLNGDSSFCGVNINGNLYSGRSSNNA